MVLLTPRLEPNAVTATGETRCCSRLSSSYPLLFTMMVVSYHCSYSSTSTCMSLVGLSHAHLFPRGNAQSTCSFCISLHTSIVLDPHSALPTYTGDFLSQYMSRSSISILCTAHTLHLSRLPITIVWPTHLSGVISARAREQFTAANELMPSSRLNPHFNVSICSRASFFYLNINSQFPARFSHLEIPASQAYHTGRVSGLESHLIL
jgi:hypothetical protein